MWRNYFYSIKEITNDKQQIYFGDFYVKKEKTSDYYEYLELKTLTSDNLFIETWSCRFNNNVGWIYKQLETEYLVYETKNKYYIIDYEKLRNLWFRIYPNPINYNDYYRMQEIVDKYSNNIHGWCWNRTKEINKSEGFYIPVSWFKKNKLIIEEGLL